jgi:hypothetical protein
MERMNSIRKEGSKKGFWNPEDLTVGIEWTVGVGSGPTPRKCEFVFHGGLSSIAN